MNWVLANRPSIAVDVPSVVESELLAAIDGAGEFPLDQYAKSFIGAERIPKLLETLQSAMTRREAVCRDATRLRLNLLTWQEWADPVLQNALRSDLVLKTMKEMSVLCQEAIRLNTGITHNVD